MIGFVFMVMVIKETKGLTNDKCKELYSEEKFLTKEKQARVQE